MGPVLGEFDPAPAPRSPVMRQRNTITPMSRFEHVIRAACVALGLTCGLPVGAQDESSFPHIDDQTGQLAAPLERTLMIVFADHLKDAADEWAAYRASEQGGQWRTVLHEVKPAADPKAAAR